MPFSFKLSLTSTCCSAVFSTWVTPMLWKSFTSLWFSTFFCNNFFSKKMILNCIGSKRIVLESSPSSDRYSAQSLRWISVFHCRPDIEINRMTTIDKLLLFLVPLGMLHSFIVLGCFVILSLFETVFRKKKRKTTLLQLIGLCLSLNGSLRKASSFSLNNKIRICHGWLMRELKTETGFQISTSFL